MMELDFDTLALGLGWFAVFVFSATLHEAGHAWAAYRLGDPTAYHAGQVTLNPAPHLQREPVGMLVVPVVSFLLNGWMIGWASAPYDPAWALRHPRRAALMAVAGPAGNLLLVVAAGVLMRIGMAGGVFLPADHFGIARLVQAADGSLAAGAATLLSILFMLNLLLFVFNLLPIAPLDGSAVVPLLLDRETARRYQQFIWQPSIALFGLLVAWLVLPRVFPYAYWLALSVLFSGME